MYMYNIMYMQVNHYTVFVASSGVCCIHLGPRLYSYSGRVVSG
jgi:hypothetical protein